MKIIDEQRVLPVKFEQLRKEFVARAELLSWPFRWASARPGSNATIFIMTDQKMQTIL